MGKSVCAWCGALLGQRPDLADGAVSHGICSDCAGQEFPPAIPLDGAIVASIMVVIATLLWAVIR